MARADGCDKVYPIGCQRCRGVLGHAGNHWYEVLGVSETPYPIEFTEDSAARAIADTKVLEYLSDGPKPVRKVTNPLERCRRMGTVEIYRNPEFFGDTANQPLELARLTLCGENELALRRKRAKS